MVMDLRNGRYARSSLLEASLTSSESALRDWTRSSPTTEARLFLTR